MSKMFPFINAKPFNPLAGECFHKCRYCWVEQLKKIYPVLKAKYSGETRIIEHELKRIKEYKAGDFAFVCDCCDLFGYWVPNELIHRILDALSTSPATFLLLTKNPGRYKLFKIPNNCICGATVESDIDHLLSGPPEISRLQAMMNLEHPNKMLSVEPIMPFSDGFIGWIQATNPNFGVAVGYNNYNSGLPEPSLAETEKLIADLEKRNIKVYRKTLREPHEAKNQ